MRVVLSVPSVMVSLGIVVISLLSGCGEESRASRERKKAEQQRDAVKAKHDQDVLDAESIRYNLGEFVAFPELKVQVRQPKGFTKTSGVEGFAQTETKSSVTITHIDEPFEKATAIFTEAYFKSRGCRYHGKKLGDVGHTSTVRILYDETTDGVLHMKCLFAIGDEEETVLLTAASPKEREKELGALLTATAESMQWIPAAETSSPEKSNSGFRVNYKVHTGFEITPSSKMKLAQNLGLVSLYTKDGQLSRNPQDPLFVVTFAKDVVANESKKREEFAKFRLTKTATVKDAVVRSCNPISVNQWTGFEIIADAADQQSGEPIVVYQTILFPDQNTYWSALGLIGKSGAEEFMPEFKSMARSLSRR